MRAINIYLFTTLIILCCSIELMGQYQSSATKQILEKVIVQNQDSLISYFDDSAKLTVKKRAEKVKMALFYKSVEQLNFRTPVTLKLLKAFDLVNKDEIVSLINPSDIEEWNNRIENYQAKKWKKEELPDIQIVDKIPGYMKSGNRKDGEIQYLYYYSTPFLNKEGNKALIYELKYFDPATVTGRLFILSKEEKAQEWEIIYKGIVFTS